MRMYKEDENLIKQYQNILLRRKNVILLVLLACLPFDERLMQADRLKLSAWELCPEALAAMRSACEKLAPPAHP